jgi:hypothetical protein
MVGEKIILRQAKEVKNKKRRRMTERPSIQELARTTSWQLSGPEVILRYVVAKRYADQLTGYRQLFTYPRSFMTGRSFNID